jgi:prepilin-type N-terminal cleavage/methylation domain-containing protein
VSADPPLRRLRGREGFSLIEVLAAMVILAVGLLALESMAIGAARQVAAANRTTEYTLIARDRLEVALDGARANVAPQNGVENLPNGTSIATVANGQAVAGGTLWNVSVTVTPPSTVTNVQPVTLRGSYLQ